MPSSPAVDAQQEVRARRLASTTGLSVRVCDGSVDSVGLLDQEGGGGCGNCIGSGICGGRLAQSPKDDAVGLVRAERAHHEEALGTIAAVGLIEVLALFDGGGGPRLGAVLEGTEHPQHGSKLPSEADERSRGFGGWVNTVLPFERSARKFFVLAEWSIGTLELLSRRGERVEERVVHGVLTRGWFEPPALQCEIGLLRRGCHARAGQR